ncbi:MAG: hypothetical protein AAFY71_01665 [Bacteroidota bacterium]
MRLLIFSLISLLSLSSMMAQYESVVLDYEKGYFNNGQALPAESRMIFSGEINEDIAAVQISLYKKGGRKPLYEVSWIKAEEGNEDNFYLPFNYRLQSNSSYDLLFTYFQELKRSDKKDIMEDIMSKIDFYNSQFMELKEGEVKLKKPAKKFKEDLDKIFLEGLAVYRPTVEVKTTFSDLVEELVSSLEKDSTFTSIDKFEELLESEVNQALQRDWLGAVNERKIYDYPTEKKGGQLALNIGYGGALLSGDPDNFSYGQAPYIGLSIPWSNRAYGYAFFRNTSLSVGAFTQNFTGPQNQTFTGPVFNRPYFVGLGYNVFKFIRINAGAVVLEETTNSNGQSLQLDRISIQPFIGLSAELRFSLGNGN